MMDAYRLSETAALDLANIRSFLRRSGGELIANRMIARLRDSFELLAEHPYMGGECLYLEGLRSHPVSRTRYIILYFPDRRPIEIYRVLHGSQDIEQLFK